MAEKLGVAQSSYSRYEKEDGDITLSQLNKISEIFGMKPEELLMLDEKYNFTNYGSNANANYGITSDTTISVNNGIGDKERELFEKNMQLMEDKIHFLLEKINILEKK